MTKMAVYKPAKLVPVVSLPLYSSRVCAGFPSPADDFIEEYIDLNRLWVKQPDATYFVKAIGDSMVDAGIEPGDFLIVDSALVRDVKDGMIVIACINGEATVKRYRVIKGQFWLYPENHAKGYKPICITEAMDFVVWGVVRSFTRSLVD